MKILSRIIRVLVWGAYILIILLLLIAAPILSGNTPVVVLSGSMRPTYPVGSVTYYKPADFDKIGVGDVITFKIGGGSLATHRVTAADKATESFTTKGDNNGSADATPVPYASVKGKTAKFAIPYAGYFVSYAQHWYVIAGCALLLFLDMLLSPGREKGDGERNGIGEGETGRRENGRRKGKRKRPTIGEEVLRNMEREALRNSRKSHTGMRDSRGKHTRDFLTDVMGGSNQASQGSHMGRKAGDGKGIPDHLTDLEDGNGEGSPDYLMDVEYDSGKGPRNSGTGRKDSNGMGVPDYLMDVEDGSTGDTDRKGIWKE